MNKVRVLHAGQVDLGREIRLSRTDQGRCRIDLVDRFLGTDAPFLTAVMEYSAIAMTLGGCCTAIEGERCYLAFTPVGDEVTVTFQRDDWPFPVEWPASRNDFHAEVLALL